MGKVEVIRATPERQPVLANLLELYIHDFSEFLEVAPGDDGRFGYPHLPLYWLDANRHPFLVRLDGKWAGFVLVKKETAWDMAEFFILRACRRRGIGTEVAHEIWRRFPGPWVVRVMEANRGALPFWERAITRFTGVPVRPALVEKESTKWNVFSFGSPEG